MKIQFIRDKILGKAREQVDKFAKGNYPSPYKIIEVVNTGLSKSREEGFAHEARAFGELTQTTESRALIGLFHGQTHCKKNHFGQPKNQVKTIAVLGAGLMGAGIAQVSINKGIQTVLKDTTQQGLTRGQDQIVKGLEGALKKKRISILESNQFRSNLLPTLNYDQFKSVDIVVEAVFEDLKIKHKVKRLILEIIFVI